jgi:VWFA-related protein
MVRLMRARPVKISSERFAVFTSSGHVEQDFTANRELLNAALGRMKPQPLQQNVSGPCPPHISYYQAYQIAELENTQVLHVVMDDFAQCPGSPGGKETLERYVRAEAQQQLSLGETDVRTGLLNLQSVIRRMGTLPGQRVIALLSPGFFVPSSTQDTNQVIDLATRAKVVLNAVDTRGVYLLDVGADATSRTIPSPDKIQVASVEQHVNGRVLSELADGTGGLFFHGRNDLDAGLLQATGEPEFSYVLGFSPRELKRDGKYHKLKVTVPANLHATVQARQGYFAPREPEDPEAAAEQEMELAVASRDSFSDVPIQCQTSIHQNVSGNFRLTVVARIDAKGFRFQRLADRNKDSVRVVAAIFDGNGNILTAKYNTVMMALRDSTLTTIAKTGIRARFEFDVQPGNYLLRVVARESEGPLMGAAELPVIVP